MKASGTNLHIRFLYSHSPRRILRAFRRSAFAIDGRRQQLLAQSPSPALPGWEKGQKERPEKAERCRDKLPFSSRPLRAGFVLVLLELDWNRASLPLLYIYICIQYILFHGSGLGRSCISPGNFLFLFVSTPPPSTFGTAITMQWVLRPTYTAGILFSP